MEKWTEDGWELLENIAINAYLFTGFESSARNVIEDARRVCKIVLKNPNLGKIIINIFGEERFWHPFHDGKVIIWKAENGIITFVGAFYSLPEEVLI